MATKKRIYFLSLERSVENIFTKQNQSILHFIINILLLNISFELLFLNYTVHLKTTKITIKIFYRRDFVAVCHDAQKEKLLLTIRPLLIKPKLTLPILANPQTSEVSVNSYAHRYICTLIKKQYKNTFGKNNFTSQCNKNVIIILLLSAFIQDTVSCAQEDNNVLDMTYLLVLNTISLV